MHQLVFDNTALFTFSSAGNLVNNEGFLHGDRRLDTFVLLIGKEGGLHIAQNEEMYTLTPNRYLLLFPGMRHYGYRHSETLLSYYWCHFYIAEDKYQILSADGERVGGALVPDGDPAHYGELAEFGECFQPEGTHLQFRHLIDNSRQAHRLQSLLDLSISLLVQEIVYKNSLHEFHEGGARQIGPSMTKVVEYITDHYASDMSVSKLAERFGYNANYLSSTFKMTVGQSLVQFIHRTRLDAAKILLLNSSNSIKFIAAQVGIHDEKHFMKLFRNYENTTPTKYRNMYFHNHINNS